MNCKNWERQIYLYDELSPSEQKQLGNHLLTCESCTETMQIARKGMNFIIEAKKATAHLESPEILTRAIMNEIKSGVDNKSQSIFSTILDHVFTRYAFAAASFLIIIFFMVEQNSVDEPSKIFMKMPRAKGVTLNSSSFVKNILNDQNKKPKATIL